ncbi:hypothetical protein [Winogradskyella sp. Asnod2-B02-A]|uniref:hypothetical protein n=1 Tax=Winogradskyella sp. Asnod2-B02-A TaxID=3160583 RepID=UPI00386EAC35
MKKDDIENRYSELEAFSKAPPEELWDNIEARLHPKKKKRRVFFIWGSAAAILVMFIGYVFTNSLEHNGKPAIEVSDIEQPKNDSVIERLDESANKVVNGVKAVNEDAFMEEGKVVKESLNHLSNQEESKDRSKSLNTNEYQNDVVNNNTKLEQKEERKNGLYDKNGNHESEASNADNYVQTVLKESITDKQEGNANMKEVSDFIRKNKSVTNSSKEKLVVSVDSIAKVSDDVLLDLSEELVAENENDSIITTKVAGLKWSVEVLGGLANTASESSIQNTAVNTTSQNDFVYTLKVGYAISDRFVVKSGIGKNVLGQEINNIKYTGVDTSLSAGDSQNIVSHPDILFLVSEESINDVSSFDEYTNEGVLQQQFDYIQVPLEFSYNVLRAQKFDLSLGIGGNVNFLTNNRAFLDNEDIGENLGANTTVFGATMNSSISYNLAKKTILFLEPSYNYFEKPIDNNNQTFENTQLRVLFGLRYKF